ncbi:MAG: DUF1476 domain-containing protein [Alphaproteobacteria bacterium]|nr:DUF1476 domain-containing protein [Alphaproteobacteria bacterium]
MAGMDDRENAMESKYAYGEGLDFKVEARGCKLFGLKIAEKIGLDGEEALSYALSVVSANLEEPGFDDVFRKVKPDLEQKNIVISDHVLDVMIAECLVEARKQLTQD